MVVNNAMEENRFLRAYQEHKREKEQLNYRESNSRFDCLRENRSPPVNQDAGRFECLRGNSSYSNQDSRVSSESNRFSCLAGDDYQSYPRQPERVTYLPRPEPRESVNDRMKRYQEEKRAIEAAKPPPPPEFSYDSNYHFPELGKEQEKPTNSKMPKPKPVIKLPEPKAPKEMILNTILVPDKRKTLTLMCFKNGKLESKEVYEDGTEVPEKGLVVLKKPNYSSWASVIKSERVETTLYESEDDDFVELELPTRKN
jgi:hypothetical protein